MEFYGIQGPLLKWTASFLKIRSQSVLVEMKYSTPAKVLSGVPQGTVLGLLLFLIHINVLPSVVTSQVRLFAEDCLMWTAWQIGRSACPASWPAGPGALGRCMGHAFQHCKVSDYAGIWRPGPCAFLHPTWTGAFCGRGGQISWRTYLLWPQLVSPYFLNHWQSRLHPRFS